MNSTCRLSTKQMWKAFCGYFQINLHIHSMQVFCQLIYITKLYRCLLTLLVVVTLSFGTLKSNWITDSGITISESESEIHNQKYHCATILHLSTGTNTGFCICVQKKWNSTKLMNDQKNCQLSENVKHWTKSRGQSSSNRCDKNNNKRLWFGLLIKGGSSHKSPTAAQFVSLLSSTTTKCLVVSIKDTQGNLPTP